MPKTDLERWQAIEGAAVRQLREAGHSIRGVGAMNPICQLIHFESYRNVLSYTLSQRKEPLDGIRYFAIRTVWDRVVSRERFNPVRPADEPEITTSHRGVADEVAEKLIALLNAVNLPVVATPPGLTLDGDLYEFSVGSSPSITFKFGPLPQQWKELEAIVEEVMALVPEAVV